MPDISDKEFQQIAQFLKAKYGIKLSNSKKALVMGRMENVLKRGNFKSFTDFFNYLLADKTGQAVTTLINRLTTNHTYFMREAQHFEFFKGVVLPYLVSTSATRDLRIWSAGCSSGEEPYTLSMILADYFRDNGSGWDTKLLATDISTEVLSKALEGRYLNENITSLPKQWQTAYFTRLDAERSVVVDHIRNNVIYRMFNLKDPFPFKQKFQVIFCRNVMIYFDVLEREALINKFYEYTEPGGYLFVGQSESINRDKTKYKYILPAVYRKE